MRRTRNPDGPLLVRFLIAIPMTVIFLAGFTLIPAVALLAAGQTALNTWTTLPSTLTVPSALPQRSRILAADGTVIATFYAENRVPLTLADIPDNVKNAILATEDARFPAHHGVDWLGTARAVVNNARGLPRQGGSGITQQYVKNLLVLNATSDTEREQANTDTYWRKIKEARYALALEHVMTKDEIFSAYLNTVYFGDGAYGIGAAAQHYFNTDAKNLTLGQAALLAGVINNPTAYDPTNNLAAAVKRRAHVLTRMLDEHMITQQEADQANASIVMLHLTTPANGCTTSPYPIYCQWVRETLQNNPVFGQTPAQRQQFLYQGGLTVTTALDPAAQQDAEHVARQALPAAGRIATAIAVVQPGTGHVLALATNKQFGQGKGQTELLLPTREAFQNASTFKPFTAAAALEQGINPSLIINAGPTYIPGNNRRYPDGGFHNAGDSAGGTMDMTGALHRSVNTWFVELEDRIGVLNTARVAKAMGLTSLPLDGPTAITEKDAALTLGAWDTSPLQVANAYATLAAHGLACPPVSIITVTGPDGTDLPVPDTACTQVIRASTADTVTSMLTGVIYAPEGTGWRAKLAGDRPAAGKTGSTNDYGAAWFAGYTPQYATAVWVGDPRGPQFNMSRGVTAFKNEVFHPVYGGTIPALVWKNTMDRLHHGLPVQQFAPPGGESTLGLPNLVPDVRGMPPATAVRVLTDAGFTPTIAAGDDTVIRGIPTGMVTGTIPAAGTRIAITGRPITVLVR
jgi:membrane peptidoglycan carboxypeptidase